MVQVVQLVQVVQVLQVDQVATVGEVEEGLELAGTLGRGATVVDWYELAMSAGDLVLAKATDE